MRGFGNSIVTDFISIIFGLSIGFGCGVIIFYHFTNFVVFFRRNDSECSLSLQGSGIFLLILLQKIVDLFLLIFH